MRTDGEYHSAESELEEDADTSRKTSKKRKIEGKYTNM